ncbi:hypothetical protein [Actinocatenispora rupis]|uniref:Uncharacterized protein n=1 Tax=Actinocatenispora rupis TaxID=519421 RepID=A0A8J3JEL6_9ACTN|nr:hypothetical protein [Actinocatenispora rupis]GID15042.1 hypothetical protein Aru02nite_59310 [Actinocatenispora rupis]
MIRTSATGALLIVLGVVLAGLGVHQLGVVRAARKWPSAPQPRLGRGLAGTELAAGILATAGGAVVLATLVPLKGVWQVGFEIVTGLVVLILGMVIAAKVADRVELNALIRSPSPLYRTTAPRPGGHHQIATSPPAKTTPPMQESDRPDPSVPADARPGWVFTDDAGSWYLCVEVGRGHRLVRLPEFLLVEPDPARRVHAAGTVELSVWPLDAGGDGDPPAADPVGTGVRSSA